MAIRNTYTIGNSQRMALGLVEAYPRTREEIADIIQSDLGVSRSAVDRLIATLTERGWVALTGDAVAITPEGREARKLPRRNRAVPKDDGQPAASPTGHGEPGPVSGPRFGPRFLKMEADINKKQGNLAGIFAGLDLGYNRGKPPAALSPFSLLRVGQTYRVTVVGPDSFDVTPL